jgi:ERF superfamily
MRISPRADLPDSLIVKGAASKGRPQRPKDEERMSDNLVIETETTALKPFTSMAVDPWVAMIERAARDPNVDPDKMLKLYELAERARTARAREAFSAAMAEAKGEIGPIFKNRTVDFTSQKGRTNYRHEDFAEVARTADPVLKRHGLSYRFRAAQSGKKLTVTCIVSHADGYSEETVLEADNDESGNKNSIQSIGSAATYLQRYTLKLALGLAATLDDDGKATTIHAEPIDAAKVKRIEGLLSETGTVLDVFLTAMAVDSIEAMTPAKYAEAEALLLRKKAGAARKVAQ